MNSSRGTVPSDSTDHRAPNRSTRILRLGVGAAAAALLATAMMPTANGAKKVSPKSFTYQKIEFTSTVIGQAIAKSRTLIPLGSFDSGRPELGTVSVSCAGKRKLAPCSAQSSVKGRLKLTKFTTQGTTGAASPQAAKGKKKGGGGGGGGGGGSGTTAPGSSAAPTNRVPGGNPPPSSLPPEDDDWNYGFCIGEFCVVIWGDKPFMADPLGGGNTSDGQGPRLSPKL